MQRKQKNEDESQMARKKWTLMKKKIAYEYVQDAQSLWRQFGWPECWVFALITLTYHVLGKCRQYSAALRHDGWCVCRHRWTMDPIISWGKKGGARHHRGKISDDWLNQNRGPSWMAVCWHYCEANAVGVNATAQWPRRAVTPSKKIKCIPFLNWSRRALSMWWGKTSTHQEPLPDM